MSADTRGDVLTSATVSDVGKKPMVMRSIRVPLKLWEAAKARADAEERDISEVVRDLLARYARGVGK